MAARAAMGWITLALVITGEVAPVLFPNPGPRAGADIPPFGIGEKLVYKVEWNPPWFLFFLPSMDAGQAELWMVEETSFQDKKALRIVFTARSSGTLVRLVGVTVDDCFEFFTDSSGYCTFAAKKRIREGKRKREIEVVYFPESRRLHILEINAASNPPRVDKDEFIEDIPDCVRDVFSALYAIRLQEFEVGASFRSFIGDNDRIKEVETRVEKREMIETPLGIYEAWRLNTVALLGGLFKSGGKFNIWLSTDHGKVPVKFEAKVKLGTVSGKLKSFQPAGGIEENGADHKPNSVSLECRDGNHSSGPGIAPGILQSTQKLRTGHP